MKLVNDQGRELKTTLSDDIMNQMCDIIEDKLTEQGVFYLRDGTKFKTPPELVDKLNEAHLAANKELFDKGIITPEMIIEDIETNFNVKLFED